MRVLPVRLTIALATLMAPARVLSGQAVCPAEAGQLTERGWRAYRGDSLALAAAAFSHSDALCPANLDAKVGLGYVALRRGSLEAADSLFRRVLSADSDLGRRVDRPRPRRQPPGRHRLPQFGRLTGPSP